MTVRDEVEYAFDDPDDGWFGGYVALEPDPQPTLPAPPVDAHVPDAPLAENAVAAADDFDTDNWYMSVADPGSSSFVDDVRHEPVFEARAAAPLVTAPRRASWETRPSGSSAWDFKSTPAPSPTYRSKYAALAAVVVAAGALIGAVLLLRSPASTVDDSPTVAPSLPAPSSSAPAPSSSAPALSSQVPAPLPPPPPPPPPAPTAEQMSPPVVNRQYSPSYQTPDAPKKPQMDVTRAPLSATPPPPPKPDRNSSTPGDAPRRGGWHW